jgi:hypothetical protein
LSPACITRASPSRRTIAWSRDGTKLIYSRGCTGSHTDRGSRRRSLTKSVSAG